MMTEVYGYSSYRRGEIITRDGITARHRKTYSIFDRWANWEDINDPKKGYTLVRDYRGERDILADQSITDDGCQPFSLPYELGWIGARETAKDGHLVAGNNPFGIIRPYSIQQAQGDIRRAIVAALNVFTDVPSQDHAMNINVNDNRAKRLAALDGNTEVSPISLFRAMNKMIDAARNATRGYMPYDFRICHGSCHNNCHGSRGRR